MSKKILCLFDVDGTLTPARNPMQANMKEFLDSIAGKVTLGVVSGSDLPKGLEQLGADAWDRFEYLFPENGLVAFHKGKEIHRQNLAKALGEENLQKLTNWILGYLCKIELPFKRGTFIEYRAGMINVSPVGRNCTNEERAAFNEYDKEHKIREKMKAELEKNFGESMNLHVSIGGMISMDVFPKGFDKTYCLKHVRDAGYDKIYFFGDKTYPGGNDYELYSSSEVTGISVESPDETIAKMKSEVLAHL